MSVKRRLASFSSNAKRYAKRTIAEMGRNERNVDIYLRSILQDGKILLNVNDAAAYIELLRACTEPIALRVETVKSSNSLGDVYGYRFKTLIETIQSNLLPLPVAMALELAEEADCLRGMTAGIDWENTWSGDVGLHFGMSSSSGHKGRLLSNVIRLCRSERCLELGTGYGMSAMFVLGMQPYLGWKIHLTTVELAEPQFTLVNQRLKQRYQDAINCHFGWTKDVLPKLMSKLGPIDYVFHDAMHTREDYSGTLGPWWIRFRLGQSWLSMISVMQVTQSVESWQTLIRVGWRSLHTPEFDMPWRWMAQ